MPEPDDSIPFPGTTRAVQPSPGPATSSQANAHDARLLAEIAAGHSGALAELYRARGGVLFSLLIRMLGDEMEAEEVLQDTFVRIWKRAGSYEAAQSGPFTWMVLLARGLAVDRLRVRARRADLRAAASDESGDPEWSQSEASTGANGFTQLAAREHANRVGDALAGLPEEQRITLELAFFKGCSQEEIARSTGQPLGTVKARIRRGMLALKRRLKGIHD